MWSDVDVDCTGYDKLILCVAAPAGSVVRVTAATDKGERSYAAAARAGRQSERAVRST